MRTREAIDYLTFVPNGEPTLDVNLGREIELLKPLKFKIAVITNSSLLWHREVRENLRQADLVSLKIDTISEKVWWRINRPYRTLRLSAILDGLKEFARIFPGELVTETMLVKGINDDVNQIKALADFLGELKPVKAYLSIPTRPPAEKWVKPPATKILNRLYQIFRQKIDQVEFLTAYEGSDFILSGDTEEAFLDITAVHLLREEAVTEILKRVKGDWSIIHKMIEQDKLVEIKYKGKRFYRKKYPVRAAKRIP